MSEPKNSGFSFRALAKRLGVLTFLFFLIKGLLWLIVPALLIWWGVEVDW